MNEQHLNVYQNYLNEYSTISLLNNSDIYYILMLCLFYSRHDICFFSTYICQTFELSNKILQFYTYITQCTYYLKFGLMSLSTENIK